MEGSCRATVSCYEFNLFTVLHHLKDNIVDICRTEMEEGERILSTETTIQSLSPFRQGD